MMNLVELKSAVTSEHIEAGKGPSEADIKEIQRLRFVLDKSNRYPNMLSSIETLRLSRKLADLERKIQGYE